jgi:benzoylformate decarboxylase
VSSVEQAPAKSAVGTTVLDFTREWMRRRGLTTVFGNPGSTELAFLADYPNDFSYVLGLQEAVVVGMADGFAQASGRPALVNLHTAPGVGNAMGGIFNAQANHTPLVITAGQQARELITLQANLTNRDAARMPHPLVKWSYEPPRAEDVPLALARAAHVATLPPAGPVFVSIPMDDWDAEVDVAAAEHAIGRIVSGRAGADPQTVRELAQRIADAQNPVFIAGPDIDAGGGWDAAIKLVEAAKLPVWAIPAPGGGRIGFPENHPNFVNILPPAIGPVAETLVAHDLILVVGASVFSYYPNIPGPLLPENSALVQLTSDPDEAARAPMGDAIVADVKLTLEALGEALPPVDREAPPPRDPPIQLPETDPPPTTNVMATLAEVWPENGIAVVEAPTSTLAVRNQLRLSQPGSYYFGAGGGLGFGLSAAVGVQLAQRDRPTVCILGEGSAQYAIQAFWSAAAYEVPLTVLVVRNDEYSILKWFSMVEEVAGAPGLDLPALDVPAVAEGYGVRSRRVEGIGELRSALSDAIASPKPEVVEVRVAPGMSLG